jgi:hypothetical protein
VIASALAYIVGRFVALIFFVLVLRWLLSIFLAGPRLVWTTSLLAFVIASASFFAKAQGDTMQEFWPHAFALALCTVIVIALWLWAQRWIESRNG